MIDKGVNGGLICVNFLLTYVNLMISIRDRNMDYGDNWKTIIETAHDGILIVDTKGVIMAVNKAAERLTGYTAEELVGNPCAILNCTGCRIFKGENGK